jgi:hypothetical protein
MYGNNRDMVFLFIQNLITHIFKKVPIFTTEETILSLGCSEKELLFNYMSRIGNYILSFGNGNMEPIPTRADIPTCADIPAPANQATRMLKYFSTCDFSKEDNDEDDDDNETGFCRLQFVFKEGSKYEGYSKQNNIQVHSGTFNEAATNAWLSERIDRFKSREVFESSYGTSQLLSHMWFLMHNSMMYYSLKLFDSVFKDIQDEYLKFKYISVNVGVIDYRSVSKVGSMMEDYMSMFPSMQRSPFFREVLPKYKSGKIKTDEFMLDIANEIKKKKIEYRKEVRKENSKRKS